MINFIDTHTHLYKEYYENIDEIIKLASEKGIKTLINAGCDSESNKEVLDLSNMYSNVYCTLGIHPENVDKYNVSDLDFIINNLNNSKVLAIGEIGLDYYYSKDNKEEQIKLFESQLALAEKYHMPVVVHSREATEDTIKSLKKYNVKGVIHSFSGSLETAKIYEKMGFYFGINGVITFKNANIKDVYKDIPLKYILLETDAPYLSPEPKRGTKNNSSNIIYIADFVAKIYNISLEELAKITNENAKTIFDKLQ